MEAGRPPGRDKLTEQQKRFAKEYSIDLNGARAIRAAGYTTANPALKANDLLKQPMVAAYVQDLIDASSKEIGITRKRVLEQYAKIGFFDIRTLYDEDGNMKPIGDMDDNAGAAISGIKSDIFGQEIKIRDTKAALDSIVKMNGWNMPEKQQIDQTQTLDLKLSSEDIKAIRDAIREEI